MAPPIRHPGHHPARPARSHRGPEEAHNIPLAHPAAPVTNPVVPGDVSNAPGPADQFATVPGLNLALPRFSLPSHPLFRTPPSGGLVPIAAPAATSTTPAPPLSAVDQLHHEVKVEIRHIRQQLEERLARHPDRPLPRHPRFEELMRLSFELGRLKVAGQIRSRGFRDLVGRARQLLLEGAVGHRRQSTEEGQRITQTVWSYHQANDYRQRVVQAIYDRYPPTSQGIHLDYYTLPEAGRNAYEASSETLNNLPLIRTYQTLSRSSNPQDQEMAGAISGVIAEMNNHHGLGDTVTLEELESDTGLVERLYGNPQDREHPHAILRFLDRVQETEQRDMEGNAGFQSRRHLQESLSSIQTLRRSLVALEQASGETIPAEALQQTREDIVRRLESSATEISHEMTRLRENRPRTHPVRYMEDGHWVEELVPDPNPSAEERRLESLHQEITNMQQQISAMPQSDPQAVPHLTEAMRFALRAEEQQTQILMRAEIRQANDPTLEAEMSRVESGTGNFTDTNVRLEHYQHMIGRLDISLLRESVRSRIEMYRNMLPQVRSTDRTMTVLSAGQGGTSDFASRYEALIHHYETIAGQIDSGNVDQARHAFMDLESAQIGTDLQDHVVFAGRLQTGIALGMIAASGAVMGAAGLAFMPETALAIEAGEATLGMRLAYAAATAPVFQVTHYALSDFLTGTHNFEDLTASGFMRDYVRTVGNNAVIGETLRFCQQAAFARIAERQLIQEGALASGAVRSVSENALIRLRMARVAQNASTARAVNAAAIVPEVGAIQAWGFLDRSLSDALDGHLNVSRSLEDTLLNPEAWRDQALFVLGMRVGNFTTSPIFGNLHGAAREVAIARVRSRYDQAIEASRIAGVAWHRYSTRGEGDGIQVRRLLQQAVEARQRLQEHTAVRALVTSEDHAEAQFLTGQLAEAQARRIYPTTNPYNHPVWGLGFALLGAGSLGSILPSRQQAASPSASTSNTPSTPASAPTPNPRIRLLGFLGALHDMPGVLVTNTESGNAVEIAIPENNLSSMRRQIARRATGLGLQVSSVGQDDHTLVMESPQSSGTPQRLTVHFTAMQRQPSHTDPPSTNLPRSPEASANPAFIFARDLARSLRGRITRGHVTSYDPQSQTLRIYSPSRDLIRVGDLVENNFPEMTGRRTDRVETGDGRHLMRVRDVDGRPVLTIEITNRRNASQPQRLPQQHQQPTRLEVPPSTTPEPVRRPTSPVITALRGVRGLSLARTSTPQEWRVSSVGNQRELHRDISRAMRTSGYQRVSLTGDLSPELLHFRNDAGDEVHLRVSVDAARPASRPRQAPPPPPPARRAPPSPPPPLQAAAFSNPIDVPRSASRGQPPAAARPLRTDIAVHSGATTNPHDPQSRVRVDFAGAQTATLVVSHPLDGERMEIPFQQTSGGYVQVRNTTPHEMAIIYASGRRVETLPSGRNVTGMVQSGDIIRILPRTPGSHDIEIRVGDFQGVARPAMAFLPTNLPPPIPVQDVTMDFSANRTYVHLVQAANGMTYPLTFHVNEDGGMTVTNPSRQGLMIESERGAMRSPGRNQEVSVEPGDTVVLIGAAPFRVGTPIGVAVRTPTAPSASPTPESDPQPTVRARPAVAEPTARVTPAAAVTAPQRPVRPRPGS